MASSGFTLAVEGLAKRYGAVRALTDVTFEARSGQVHAVIGENGAGKSTLVKVLAGLVRRDTGTLRCDGEEFDFHGPTDAASAGVEIAFQESGLIANLSVAQNLVLGREDRSPMAMRSSVLRARAEEILAESGARMLPVDVPVGQLSLADRQVLEVVRAISPSPKVLVLDEANSSLSGTDNVWFLESARRIASDGGLVLFITHRLAEVREVADRFTVLRGGRSVLSGSPAALSNDDIIEAMVGTRVRELAANTQPHSGRDRLVVRDLRPRGTPVEVGFTVAEGEIVGLAGLEGNGQDKVLLALGGALAWQGSVTIDGEPHRARTPAQAIAGGVALVPGDRQAEGLLGSWAIRDNITLSSLDRVCSRLGLVSRPKATRSAIEMGRRLRLPADRLDAAASSLSGGNQQRVVLARVLLTDPKVILMYDGTRGVDVATRNGILTLMKELADSGTSILFYSSDLSEYAQLAHRVLVMASGRIVGSTRGAVTEQEILRIAVESPRDTARPPVGAR